MVSDVDPLSKIIPQRLSRFVDNLKPYDSSYFWELKSRFKNEKELVFSLLKDPYFKPLKLKITETYLAGKLAAYISIFLKTIGYAFTTIYNGVTFDFTVAALIIELGDYTKGILLAFAVPFLFLIVSTSSSWTLVQFSGANSFRRTVSRWAHLTVDALVGFYPQKLTSIILVFAWSDLWSNQDLRHLLEHFEHFIPDIVYERYIQLVFVVILAPLILWPLFVNFYVVPRLVILAIEPRSFFGRAKGLLGYSVVSAISIVIVRSILNIVLTINYLIFDFSASFLNSQLANSTHSRQTNSLERRTNSNNAAEGNNRYTNSEVGIISRTDRAVIVSYRLVRITNTNNSIGGTGAIIGKFDTKNSPSPSTGIRNGFEYTLKLTTTEEIIKIVQADATAIEVGEIVNVSYGNKVRIRREQEE